jgi:hypothetical protein
MSTDFHAHNFNGRVSAERKRLAQDDPILFKLRQKHQRAIGARMERLWKIASRTVRAQMLAEFKQRCAEAGVPLTPGETHRFYEIKEKQREARQKTRKHELVR